MFRSDEGATHLAEGLRGNSELSFLSMAYCHIGPAGGVVVGEEIVRCTKIKQLKLRVRDRGGRERRVNDCSLPPRETESWREG
mmetsp:Transcript_11001/g.37359  ORF Transcript_11001/g.37359 Transcript_11001/m.37359 type:complete len:83 (+) Transcript_11001:932-1180(+)